VHKHGRVEVADRHPVAGAAGLDEHDPERRQHPLLDVLGVFRGELEFAQRILLAGPDAERVKQRLGRGPGPFVRLSRTSDGGQIERHRRSPPR
jgi:hypothetical protein